MLQQWHTLTPPSSQQQGSPLSEFTCLAKQTVFTAYRLSPASWDQYQGGGHVGWWYSHYKVTGCSDTGKALTSCSPILVSQAFIPQQWASVDVGEVFSWAHWLFGIHCELSTSVSTVARSKEHTVLGRRFGQCLMVSTAVQEWLTPQSVKRLLRWSA